MVAGSIFMGVGMRGPGLLLVAGIGVMASPAMAQKDISLPIPQGLWTAAIDPCHSTTHLNVYDGKRWGSVYYYGDKNEQGPEAAFDDIVETRPAAHDFTEMRFGFSGGASYIHINPFRRDGMIYRTGGPTEAGFDVKNETLYLCDYSKLSKKMQKAVKSHAPAFVTAKK